MPIVINPADLDAERELIIETLRRYLTPDSNAKRYDWLYKENPHGPARVWIARDTGAQTIVGVAAAFPRWLLLRGSRARAWVFGDFCIADQFRTLGPAVQLQRTLLAAARDTTDLAGWYDFPSQPMAAVYKRLGGVSQGDLVRMAKPLRGDRAVSLLPGPSRLMQGILPLVNAGLAMGIRAASIETSLSIGPHAGVFESEFDELAREAGGAYDVCIERSAEYLNWRFRNSPLGRYECLVARQRGRLCGYVLFSCTAEDAILVDLFCIKNKSIPESLLNALAVLLLRRGVMTISAPLVEGHPWRPVLERRGYRVRERSPFVTAPGLSAGSEIFMRPKGGWHFMQADRDS